MLDRSPRRSVSKWKPCWRGLGQHWRSVFKKSNTTMPWFVAHNLMVLRPQVPIDEPLLCWENMILLEADFAADVWGMAKSRALDVDASEDFEKTPHYPVPARWEFAGTRKIVTVRQDSDADGLSCGDELTFNTLYLHDQDTIECFVSGVECDIIAGDETDDPPVRNMERYNQ